jgi:dTDP-4-dehydrorhamnose reductase
MANPGYGTCRTTAARAVVEVYGEDSRLVQPAAAAALGWPAPRPSYSVLASARGYVMRSTADALSAFAENAMREVDAA